MTEIPARESRHATAAPLAPAPTMATSASTLISPNPDRRQQRANNGFQAPARAARNRQYGRLESLRQLRYIETQLMGIKDIHHVCQHGDRLAVTRAFSNHLQREIQAFLQTRGIDNAQHMADLGILQRLLKVFDRNPLIRGNCLQ